MLTSDLAEHRAAALADPAGVEAEPAVAPRPAAGSRAGRWRAIPRPGRTSARRRAPTRRAGRSTAARRPRGRGWRPASPSGAPIRGSSAGSPTAIRQAQASSGGWIVSVWNARARGDVVEGQPGPGDRPVPEDRVADEAVGALGGQQALELGPRAAGIEAAPDDRREARVPVPLPGVAAGAGAGVAEGHARRARPRASSGAGRARRSRVAALTRAVRRISRRARAPSDEQERAQARRSPGQVSPQVTPPTKPWRAASITCVIGLMLATSWSQPCSSASGA